jgi:hypothetical protein
MPSGGRNLYLPIRFGYGSIVSNNAKRNSEKRPLTPKEPPATVRGEPRYATREQVDQALKRAMDIHSEAFRKLAEIYCAGGGWSAAQRKPSQNLRVEGT